MKKLLSIIVAGSLLAGLIATAAAQGAGPKGGAPGGPGGQRGPGGPGGQGGQRGRGMAALLEKIQPPLTADQKKKIEAISKKYREQMRKLMGGGPGGPGGPGAGPKPGGKGGPPPSAGGPGGQRMMMDPAKRQQFLDLMKKQNAEIRAVLNKAQQASFDKLIAERMKRMQDRMKQGGPGAGGPPPGGKPKGGGV